MLLTNSPCNMMFNGFQITLQTTSTCYFKIDRIKFFPAQLRDEEMDPSVNI